MNKSSFIGFAIIGAVIYLGVLHNAKVPAMFMDPHAIMLVIGGTLAAALVAYPYATLTRTVDYLIWGLLFKTKQKYVQVSNDLASVRGCYLANQPFGVSDNSHPFLKESVVFLLNKNINNEALEEILLARSDYFKKRYKEDAKVLMALGKYPPAFGLLGASTGMIEMMQNLGTGGSASIGQAMAVALVATFWGIALANFVILPLADSASKAADEDNLIRNMIADGMILIRQNANDDHFQAYLRGNLNVYDRTEVKIYSSVANMAKLYNFGTKVPTALEPTTQVATPPLASSTRQAASSANSNANQNEEPSSILQPPANLSMLSLKRPKKHVKTDGSEGDEEVSGRVDLPTPVELEENSANLKKLQFRDLRKFGKKKGS